MDYIIIQYNLFFNDLVFLLIFTIVYTNVLAITLFSGRHTTDVTETLAACTKVHEICPYTIMPKIVLQPRLICRTNTSDMIRK